LLAVRGLGRAEQVEHMDFHSIKSILYDIILVDTCHYTFVQIHRRYTTKSES